MKKKNSKNTIQLVAIIALLCCTLTLLGVGIWLGVTGGSGLPNNQSNPVRTSDDEWTKNY